MKVEMLYVVLNNSMLNKRHGYINNNNNRPNNNNGTYIALLKWQYISQSASHEK